MFTQFWDIAKFGRGFSSRYFFPAFDITTHTKNIVTFRKTGIFVFVEQFSRGKRMYKLYVEKDIKSFSNILLKHWWYFLLKKVPFVFSQSILNIRQYNGFESNKVTECWEKLETGSKVHNSCQGHNAEYKLPIEINRILFLYQS